MTPATVGSSRAMPAITLDTTGGSLDAAPRRGLAGLIAVTGLVLLLWQLWAIHRLWTPVGLVDAWPLYYRMMRLDAGLTTLDHYLLDPHVHPHAIVFFLYLLDARLGSGRQVVPHVASLLSVAGLAILLGAFFWRAVLNGSRRDLRRMILISGTAILLSGLSEATIIPFQCVITVTRLVYIALLASLAYCQFHDRPVLHALSIALSVIAITFYASAGIFAAEVILLHLLALRRWRWLILSAVPLASYFLLITRYPPPPAETHAMVSLIAHPTPVMLLRIAAGASAYYATPLVDGQWFGLSAAPDAPGVAVLAFGAVVGASTILWSAITLIRFFMRQFRNDGAMPPDPSLRCLLAVTMIWVFISSISTAMLWLARQRIAPGAIVTPVHFIILSSTRYAAFAVLAIIVMLFIAASTRHGRIGHAVAWSLFVLIVGEAAFAQLDPGRVAEHIAQRSKLDQASTALLMGMSPADPDAAAVWPGVSNDPVWVRQLPYAVALLRVRNLSYAGGVPWLGQVEAGAARRVAVTSVTATPAAGPGTICRISAITAEFHSAAALAPHRVFAISGQDRRVVGYGLRQGRTVAGHIWCADADGQRPLWIGGGQD